MHEKMGCLVCQTNQNVLVCHTQPLCNTPLPMHVHVHDASCSSHKTRSALQISTAATSIESYKTCTIHRNT